jgi:elongation factor G
LQGAFSDLAKHDPSIRIGANSGGHFIICGVSESHLETIRQRIPQEYLLHADVSPSKVIYLETIRKQALADGEYIYRYGTQKRMYAKVTLRLEPLDEGSGYQFIQELPEGALPSEFAGAIDSAIQDAMKGGILAGQEIVDLRAVLCDASFDSQDSDVSAFKIAASIAFKEAIRKADPFVLEPIMAVEITGPEEHLSMSAIIGDLKSRRGRIVGSEHQDRSLLLRAIVPMAEMMGYSSFIRSNSQSQAQYSTRLIRFAEVFPRDSGGDEPLGAAIEPDDPKPDLGIDKAGVPALKPPGPNPKSRSAAAKIDTESE